MIAGEAICPKSGVGCLEVEARWTVANDVVTFAVPIGVNESRGQLVDRHLFGCGDVDLGELVNIFDVAVFPANLAVGEQASVAYRCGVVALALDRLDVGWLI